MLLLITGMGSQKMETNQPKELSRGATIAALSFVVLFIAAIIWLGVLAEQPLISLDEPEFVARYDVKKIYISADEYIYYESEEAPRLFDRILGENSYTYSIAIKDSPSSRDRYYLDTDSGNSPDLFVIVAVPDLEQAYLVIEIVAENKVQEQRRFTLYIPEE